MKAFDLDPKILATAAGLRLDVANPVQSIRGHCRERIARILKRVSGVRTISDVERVVCEHLNLVVHEIWDDDDLHSLSMRYAKDEGDPKFAALEMELEAKDAYGVLYQRTKRTERGEVQYVAFVDCRGDKHHRRFFTRWHEIAHCLTTFKQFEFPFRRVSGLEIQKEPLEKLMDMIAGELGFFDPLFVPLLKSEIRKHGKLTFAAVEGIRDSFCPEASFQSTLIACVTRADVPVVLLVAGMGLKANEKRALADLQMPLIKAPSPRRQLRVLSSNRNQAAREASLQIHKNRRVPSPSIISKVFRDEALSDSSVAQENLADWTCSDGTALAPLSVEIQAKKILDQVFAIVSPTSAKWC